MDIINLSLIKNWIFIGEQCKIKDNKKQMKILKSQLLDFYNIKKKIALIQNKLNKVNFIKMNI